MMRAFAGPDECAAREWGARGGLALLLLPPDDAAAPAPWVAPGRHGRRQARLYCADPAVLSEVARSVWVNRYHPHERGGPGQHLILVGAPLVRAVLRCSSGAVEAAPWFCRHLALGRLWCGLVRKRPVRVTLSEVRAGWTGSTPGWWEYRPGWAVYARLPGGLLEWEGAVLGRELLWDASEAAKGSPRPPPVRLWGAGRTLLGLGCRRQDDLTRLIGAGVDRGRGLAGKLFPWVRRSEP